jgi:UDP-glucose 4-epimerase
MGPNVLITGAAGGIGSVLVPYLLERDFSIIALDDLSSGSWQNIADHPNLKRVTGSILDLQVLNEIPWTQIDHVVHLAAISSLPACQMNYELAMSTNVIGTLNLVKVASKNAVNLKLFINASTSAVYESNNEIVLTESLITRPHLIYSQSKKISEDLLRGLWQDLHFPSISLRFFNVFGPMQDYTRTSPPLLNYLVREFFMNRQPILHSNGEQKRDYISVFDVCEAITTALGTRFLEYENYNICSGNQFSVNQIVEVVKTILQIEINPKFRSAELLWDAYGELYDGAFPFRLESVSSETNKVSRGSYEKFRLHTGWTPTADQESLLSKSAFEAFKHIESKLAQK